jgi:hypothetical protein
MSSALLMVCCKQRNRICYARSRQRHIWSLVFWDYHRCTRCTIISCTTVLEKIKREILVLISVPLREECVKHRDVAETVISLRKLVTKSGFRLGSGNSSPYSQITIRFLFDTRFRFWPQRNNIWSLAIVYSRIDRGMVDFDHISNRTAMISKSLFYYICYKIFQHQKCPPWQMWPVLLKKSHLVFRYDIRFSCPENCILEIEPLFFFKGLVVVTVSVPARGTSHSSDRLIMSKNWEISYKVRFRKIYQPSRSNRMFFMFYGSKRSRKKWLIFNHAVANL